MTKECFLNESVNVEFVKGGFIINYPVKKNGDIEYEREVIVSSRKLLQKVKEILANISDDPVDAE